jgi:hypothetical protein
MWDRKVGTEVRGTPNPYQTALPLAQYVGGMLIPPMPYVPEMYFTDGSHTYYLCEYPSDSNCQTTPSFDLNALVKYGQDVNSHLYSYLSAYFQTNPHVSVAIFHTSQGMPSVSWALGVKPVIAICPNDGQQKCTQEIVPPYKDRVLGNCPLPIDASTSSAKCYANEYRLLSWPGVQRSSVNIFKYQNIPQNVFVKHYQSISTNLTVNQNLLQVLEFSQCYNLDNTTQELSTADEYYCQYSGSLANNLDNANSATTETIGNRKPPLRLDKIKAKVCYPPFISANESFVADSFGHCF